MVGTYHLYARFTYYSSAFQSSKFHWNSVSRNWNALELVRLELGIFQSIPGPVHIIPANYSARLEFATGIM